MVRGGLRYRYGVALAQKTTKRSASSPSPEHQNNPVQSLSDKQIVNIYTDKINNWKQVGGLDAPITVVNKAEGRSTLELFANHFKVKTTIRADVVIGDNEQGIKTVANAIGYVSVGSVEYAATHNTPIKLLPVEGVAASITTSATALFPFRPSTSSRTNNRLGLTLY